MKRVSVAGELIVRSVSDVVSMDDDDVSQFPRFVSALLPLPRHPQPPHFERHTNAET